MEPLILSAAQEAALTRIWERTAGAPTQLKEGDMKHFYALGLGMQEALQVLYGQQPDLDHFLDWVRGKGCTTAAPDRITEDVLTPADLDHWRQHGYVVLRQAVSPDACAAAARAIWAFLGASPADRESWYRPHPARSGMMVVFTQHPALEAVRQSPRIRRAFEQLYSTSDIYRVVNKVSFNPPEHGFHTFAGSPLHWDTSLELPIPDKFDGLLYLNDVAADGGAFQCVPGFHRTLAQWLDTVPAGADVRRHALDTLKPVLVTGRAGDFIIWHQSLPHCASPNTGSRPRLVQYLNYLPEGLEDDRPWK